MLFKFKLASLFAIALAACADDVYEPLRLYQGIWLSQTEGQSKSDEIANECNKFDRYFACQQTVNGKVGSLIVFVPGAKPGDYYVQAVLPDGRAAGRVDLRIDGNHWTYQNKGLDGDKIKYYRTTNVFADHDQIHFEQSESPDGAQWMVTGAGEETRKGSASLRAH